jgi:hypothetical protein
METRNICKQRAVLLVVAKHSAHLVCDLPRLFKNGGFGVTVLAFPHWSLTNSSYIDEFIQAPEDPKEVIEQAALLITKRIFELKILSSDALIWALVDSPIDPLIKTQLSPIANSSYLNALDGKVGAAAMWEELAIPSPPSRVAHSLTEAATMATEMGFPVMLKVSRSGGGDGIFKCGSVEEIMNAPISTERPFLVEKYLDGDLMSVEPLFLQSRLVAYSYSKMTYFLGNYQPSLERIFMPCPEIEPILQKLGKELQWTGFANISLIRESKSRKLFLFELDFRPNRWIRYGEMVGVDWSRALRDPFSPLQSPQSIKKMRHFPSDLVHAIRKKKGRRILYWIFNQNKSWKSIPFYDLKYLLRGVGYAILKR